MAAARSRLLLVALPVALIAVGWIGFRLEPAMAQTLPAPGRTAAVTGTAGGQSGGAVAQEPAGAAARSSESAVAATSPVTATEQGGSSGDQLVTAAQLIRLSLLAVFFGSFALVAVLVYIYSAQKLYFVAARRMALAGKIVQAEMVGALERKKDAGADEPQPSVTVDFAGPNIVPVGNASSAYTATVTAAGDVDVTWSVEPPTAAAVQPMKGLSVVVVAAVECAFTLKATATPATGTPASKALQVAAVRANSADVTLPFVGQGYGSVAIAIVVLTVVAWLGLAQVLDGQAVATVLGGLVGYVFGTGVVGRTGGGAAGGGAGGAGPDAGGG